MPVKWVLHWRPNPGTTVSSQIVNDVCQCVESINGVKEGKWKATVSRYEPVLKDQGIANEIPSDCLGISLPEQPNKYYFVIHSQALVLEADFTIQAIMKKLQSYKIRGALFEGSQYQLGEFQLRVGNVIVPSGISRGIFMEIEYLPKSSWENSKQIMEEFYGMLQEALSRATLPGRFSHTAPKFSEYGLGDTYSPQHTSVQYATTMAHIVHIHCRRS